MIEYEVTAKRHDGSKRGDMTLYIDEDRDKAIEWMGKYVRKYGFTLDDYDRGNISVADLLLKEQTLENGKTKVLSVTPYCEIFDVATDERLDKKKKGARK